MIAATYNVPSFFVLAMAECLDVGSILSKHNVTPSMLLSCLNSSDDEYELSFLPGLQVTNSVVLDLYHFMNKHPHCSFYTLRTWLSILLGDSWPSDPPTVKAIRQSIIRLSEKFARLKKQPNWQIRECFLDDVYCLPKLCVLIKHSSSASSDTSSSYMPSSSSDNSLTLLTVNKELCKELSDLTLKYSSLAHHEEKLVKSRGHMYDQHRNDKKKLQRRNKQIDIYKSDAKQSKKAVSELRIELAEKDSNISQLKINIDRIRHRARYWKSKCDNVKQSSEEELIDVLVSGEEMEVKLTSNIYRLEQENVDLQEVVQELMASNEENIMNFQGGKYIDDIRECCFELLSLNVGIRNIKHVINTVLKNIAHKSVDRLPSQTTLCNMMLECLTLAQAQLGEELTREDADCYTLQTDGTSKYGDHFGTYDVATDETTYHLGLRQVFSGSAQTTLDTFIEILDDLDAVSCTLGSSKVSDKILTKLKNTMSDRHSAEKLFAHMLSEYRANILPDIISEWSSMSEDEKEQLTRMNNFYCGLHFVVGLADAAEATLKVWESTVDLIQTGSSSGTQRLVRTACKAFHRRGSEQAGCSVQFRTYLRGQNVHKMIPLAAFRGNRFNILFYDAAGVYFLKLHMEEYLTKHHSGPLNRLLQAVLADLRTPQYIAGCKALGIIDKLITGPFWRYLEASKDSILEMSGVYTKMKMEIDRWGCDALPLLESEVLLFPDFTNSADEVALYLNRPSHIDSMAQELLQLLCKSFSATMRRMLVDHLPGGEFHSISNSQMVRETSSVPKTNVTPERNFAVLDRLLGQKPNASYIALESLLLFSHNKTSDSKTPQEKERLFQAARTMTSVHRANFQKRRVEIERRRKEQQERKEKERLLKEKKAMEEKENLTKKISHVGLWTSEAEVREGLDALARANEKKDALKLQLKFRKKVLSQTYHDKTVFQFSHNSRAFSVSELKQNLLKLLCTNDPHPCFSAEEIAADPDILLYRRIEHQFNCNGDMVWFKGTVLGYDKGTDTLHFRVVYDNEDGECCFPLLEDIVNNEVRIL